MIKTEINEVYHELHKLYKNEIYIQTVAFFVTGTFVWRM